MDDSSPDPARGKEQPPLAPHHVHDRGPTQVGDSRAALPECEETRHLYVAEPHAGGDGLQDLRERQVEKVDNAVTDGKAT